MIAKHAGRNRKTAHGPVSTLATVKRSILQVTFPNMFLQIAYTTLLSLACLAITS